MIRIICSECKNAYLQNKGDKFACPSCGAEMPGEIENLVLGIQNYNEENFSAAADFLMKYIVRNGAEPRAIFYKALCDAFSTIDGDTDSISETYEKILECFKDFSEEDFPEYIALANDEGRKLERALAEHHVRTLENADAEKIKTEVAAILAIQKEAKDFRISLKDIVNSYNETAQRKLAVRFSECYLLGRKIAEEVGNKTYNKIIEDISNHTVFTGILSNNIKNLEIYLRCIVMFFKKSHDKYEFLKDESQKFIDIAKLLEKGQYNTIKGVESTSDKLMKEAYDFLYESYNEHYDEQIEMQTECVVILEPEAAEIVAEDSAEPQEEASESVDNESPEEAEVISAEEQEKEESEPSEATEPSSETSEEISPEEMAEPIEEIIAETDDFQLVSNEEEIEAEAEEAEESIEESVCDEAKEEPVETAIEEAPQVQDDEPQIKTLAEVKAEETQKAEAPTEDEKAPEEPAEQAEAKESKPQKSKNKKGGKGKILIALILVLIVAVIGIKYVPGAITEYKYKQATTLAEDGSYTEAIAVFSEIRAYSDSEEKIKECTYKNAEKLEAEGNHSQARIAYESLGEYKDCLTRVQTCIYAEATAELDAKNYDNATKLFAEIKDYGNSADMIKECSYRKALSLIESGEYASAIDILSDIQKYSDAAEKIKEAKYLYVTNNLDEKNKTTVKYLNELTKAEYRNSAELRKELLGSAEVANGDVKAFVNYSVTDLKTSLTELDHNKAIYFHVVVNDKALHGKPLTLKYTTQYGYSQTDSVTLSEKNNSAIMAYPSTNLGNYKVTFELLSTDGSKIASQTISF